MRQSRSTFHLPLTVWFSSADTLSIEGIVAARGRLRVIRVIGPSWLMMSFPDGDFRMLMALIPPGWCHLLSQTFYDNWSC